MQKTKCLVLMPFKREFDPVYKVIEGAAGQALSEVELIRLDKQLVAGNIRDQFINLIQGSDLCIADISGSNPNVMWELGYAYALQLPVILLGQSGEAVPFYMRVDRFLQYDNQQLDQLRQVLVGSLK